MSTLPRFPLEVEENVINQAVDDLDVLRSCALVCRDWHARSRYHLLQSIRIQSREDFARLCEYFKTHRHLAQLVRKLTISSGFSTDGPVAASSILAIAYVPLLSLLPRLRSYQLRDMARVYPVSWHPTTLVQLRTHLLVEELSLGPITFNGYSELLQVVLALRRTLRILHCREVRFAMHAQPGWDGGRASITDKLHLSAVTLLHVDTFPLLAAKLLLCPSAASLQEVYIDHKGLYELVDSGGVDFSLFKHLHVLRVDVMPVDPVAKRLQISSFAFLSTWEEKPSPPPMAPVSAEPRSSSALPADCSADLERVLQIITRETGIPPGPILTSLTITLPHVDSYSLGEDLALENIGNCCRMLDERQQRIAVVLPHARETGVASWMAVLDRALPKLSTSGLLEVDCFPGVGPGHHGAGLQSLLTSSVASWVASTSVDGHIMIWDQDCETCIRHLWLPWQYDVSTTAYFPFFGQHHDLIFAHPEGVDVAIWGIHGNKIASLRAHLQLVLCCAWSPEGDWLASASSDEVHIWRTSSFYPQSCEPRTAPRDPLLPAPFIDVHASHRRLPVPRPMGDVTSMKLSSLELYIFNVSSARAISLQDGGEWWWSSHANIPSDRVFTRSSGLGNASISCWAFPPAGMSLGQTLDPSSSTERNRETLARYCVVGLTDGTVWRRELSRVSPLAEFEDTAPYLWNQHDGSVTDVNFSSDGTLLLSTSVDMTIMVTATGSTLSPPDPSPGSLEGTSPTLTRHASRLTGNSLHRLRRTGRCGCGVSTTRHVSRYSLSTPQWCLVWRSLLTGGCCTPEGGMGRSAGMQ